MKGALTGSYQWMLRIVKIDGGLNLHFSTLLGESSRSSFPKKNRIKLCLNPQ